MNKKTSHALFHSFCVRPDIRFEAQDENEEVILVLRAHPFTQIFWIINAFIMFLILFLLNVVLSMFFNSTQILFFNFFILAIIFSYLWFNFLSWYFNVGIITNHRVVDVDFSSIIYKEVTYANLGKIEDVSSKSAGFFSSIFNYGNIFIQTAGTEVNVEFFNVPRASEVAKIVNQLIHS